MSSGAQMTKTCHSSWKVLSRLPSLTPFGQQHRYFEVLPPWFIDSHVFPSPQQNIGEEAQHVMLNSIRRIFSFSSDIVHRARWWMQFHRHADPSGDLRPDSRAEATGLLYCGIDISSAPL